MKTYLITGGCGFIGTNFIKYLFDKYNDIHVVNLDKLTYAGNLGNLADIEGFNNYKFIKGDICDKRLLEKVFRDYNIDYLINFAAESHVDRSINDPDVFIKTNVLGTQNLLHMAKKYWSSEEGFINNKRFIQISTDEVYGQLGEEGYFSEEFPLNPRSPYSASKASAEMIAKSYFETYKFPVIITRCSNNYGPYQFPEKLIPLVINNCLKHKEIPIYGDGKNIREWIHVISHCEAIDLIISKGENGSAYNIGSSNELSNLDLVKMIIDILSEKLKDDRINYELIKFVKDRKGHDYRYALDSTKLQRELDWENRMDFKLGLEKTIDWYLNNKSWLEKINSGEYQKYYKKMYGSRV